MKTFIFNQNGPTYPDYAPLTLCLPAGRFFISETQKGDVL